MIYVTESRPVHKCGFSVKATAPLELGGAAEGSMAEDARATLLVAEEEGQIVGFLYATIEKALPIFLHDEFALIREWWVEPPFRTRGVGKALLKHAAAEFTRVCVRQVRVRTSVADQDVRATIQRCGFRPGPRDMVMDLRPTS